ncbi:MAG: hypothetical protein JWP36_1837 [Paucimonas sp.]|nr:hypothetical protein [Paucimonas sp.]
MYFCAFEHNGAAKLGCAPDSDRTAVINITDAWPTGPESAPAGVAGLARLGGADLTIAREILHSRPAALPVEKVRLLAPMPLENTVHDDA